LTAEKLSGVTTRLQDIQAKLATLIDYNTILLGHSLECDLRVLKVRLPLISGIPILTRSLQIVHPWVIDTSVIYQHPRGPPFKASLKWLAQKWLKKEIQTNVAGDTSVGGHDSEEDARTCVELLNLKMQKGESLLSLPENIG
jgi:RNA exonuclease 1